MSNFPCKIIEADFDSNIVTLQMEGTYTVSAGQKYLCDATPVSTEPPLSPDEARNAARNARLMNGPSDPTQPHEYAIAGALAYAAKLAAPVAAQAQQPVIGADLSKALRDLMRGYVNLLENGRDRVLNLGGQCDSVDVMEASDPWLKSARAALAQQDADKVDAERYRWLRDPQNNVALVLDKRTGYVPADEQIPGVGGYHTYEYRAGVDLDVAIDAARKEPDQ